MTGDFSLNALGKAVLVIGGARSGKSRIAESLIESSGGGIYLATAEPGDAEMAERIAAHRARRGANWQTIEAPLEIAKALADLTASGNRRPVLIDCLTLWLSNLLGGQRDIDKELAHLMAAIEVADYSVILVSNEVGTGIVPENALARQFRDHAGLINQKVAASADAVLFVVAGIAQRIK